MIYHVFASYIIELTLYTWFQSPLELLGCFMFACLCNGALISGKWHINFRALRSGKWRLSFRPAPALAAFQLQVHLAMKQHQYA